MGIHKRFLQTQTVDTFTVDYFYTAIRGYWNHSAGNVKEDNTSETVFLRYHIRIYTKPSHWFAYPIFISFAEAQSKTIDIGKQLKGKQPSNFDITYDTGWVSFEVSGNRANGCKVGVRTGNSQSGSYGFTDLEIPSKEENLARLNISRIDNSILGEINIYWDNLNNGALDSINVTIQDDYWVKYPLTNPIRVSALSPNIPLDVRIQSLKNNGHTGEKSNYYYINTKKSPYFKLEQENIILDKNGVFLNIEEPDNSILTIEEIPGLKKENIQQNQNKLNFSNEELKQLYKYYNKNLTFVLTTDGIRGPWIDKKKLKVKTNGNINTVKIKKNNKVVLGQIYIKKTGEIKKGIIYIKKDGELKRGY